MKWHSEKECSGNCFESRSLYLVTVCCAWDSWEDLMKSSLSPKMHFAGERFKFSCTECSGTNWITSWKQLFRPFERDTVDDGRARVRKWIHRRFRVIDNLFARSADCWWGTTAVFGLQGLLVHAQEHFMVFGRLSSWTLACLRYQQLCLNIPALLQLMSHSRSHKFRVKTDSAVRHTVYEMKIQAFKFSIWKVNFIFASRLKFLISFPSKRFTTSHT